MWPFPRKKAKQVVLGSREKRILEDIERRVHYLKKTWNDEYKNAYWLRDYRIEVALEAFSAVKIEQKEFEFFWMRLINIHKKAVDRINQGNLDNAFAVTTREIAKFVPRLHKFKEKLAKQERGWPAKLHRQVSDSDFIPPVYKDVLIELLIDEGCFDEEFKKFETSEEKEKLKVMEKIHEKIRSFYLDRKKFVDRIIEECEKLTAIFSKVGN